MVCRRGNERLEHLLRFIGFSGAEQALGDTHLCCRGLWLAHEDLLIDLYRLGEVAVGPRGVGGGEHRTDRLFRCLGALGWGRDGRGGARSDSQKQKADTDGTQHASPPKKLYSERINDLGALSVNSCSPVRSTSGRWASI